MQTKTNGGKTEKKRRDRGKETGKRRKGTRERGGKEGAHTSIPRQIDSKGVLQNESV